MYVSIVIYALVTYQTASNINELTQDLSRIHASIVKSVLATHQTARNMNDEHTKELRRMYAGIVISALAAHQIAGDMNELTKERRFIHVSIEICALET